MSVLGRHRHLASQHTPASSNSLSSPFGGYQPGAQYSSPANYMSPVTPLTAVQTSAPYNPRQWNGPAPGTTASYVPYGVNVQASTQTQPSQLSSEEPNPNVAPPPPYSPRRPPGAQNSASPQDSITGRGLLTSPVPQPGSFDTSPETTAASSYIPSTAQRIRQQQSVTPTPPEANYEFPPPPPSVAGARARSSSRSRTTGGFSLSALTSRARHQPSASHAESSQQAQARRPEFSYHSPQPLRPENVEVRPPAARRAASTGTLGLHASPSRSSLSDNDPSNAPSWAPGMPLPPPPPGPPPSGSRSQSLNRPIGTTPPVQNFSSPVAAPPTRRPPPSGQSGATLPPVPPTPADWVEETTPPASRSSNKDLRIDTSESSNCHQGQEGTGSNGTALQTEIYSDRDRQIERSMTSVAPASKGIRERRNESRSGKGRVLEPQTAIDPTSNPWAERKINVKPADLVLPSPNSGLSRRPAVSKSTPRSARGTGSRPGSATSTNAPDSAFTMTPGLDSARTPGADNPLSAKDPNTQLQVQPGSASSVLPSPRSILRNGDVKSRPVRPAVETASPSTTSTMPPSRPASLLVKDMKMINKDEFAASAMERHLAFARKESVAKTDKERVQLFADFIVAESRIRRERYSEAIENMGSEILELTRDLFRPYNTSRRSAVATPTSASDRDRSVGPVQRNGTSGRNAKQKGVNRAESDSPGSAGSGSAQGQGDSTWIGGYMPSLSPIPSMSMMSERQDEESSRGRPASRWWEASQEGSVGGGQRGMERSKRESKYMGMPKELRESLQYDLPSTPNARVAAQTGVPPQQHQHQYGPNEYPPEKGGAHDQMPPPPSLPPPVQQYQSPYSPSPYTPDPRRLDVSRLVTLPPPYPRHHPAVNNNHPDLVETRTIVRSLSDFSDAEAVKEKYTERVDRSRIDSEAENKKRNSLIRQDIQRKIEAGSMSYSEAGKVEAAAQAEQNEREKARIQSEFEQFQREVVKPVHTILSERIEKATASFEELRSKLFVDAQERNPNSTQEQGDEEPELLEKLTLLKWLFEAREQLHREIYDLLTQRNDRYEAMVTLPYRLSGNEEKAKDAEAFFKKDGQDRKMTFEKETLKRIEDFMDVIEENVVRGVEVQLSAFWDIAPGLLAVCQKIPRDLDGFEIQIPPDEYTESPSYHEHPMQYLHSLLNHSEKSTYQFIEAQTNLLCLLHEVKSGVTAANCRLMETQRYLAGEDFASVDGEMSAVRKDEERRLTEDLKEKVRMVDNQWKDALGNDLAEVQMRTVDWLMQEGGWEDQED
ncbi:MAG: hypothetical protein M1814_003742 [Vezdaea aestivalis]|nr:MAG: hypothetical protein M1814_003742 [Vezdaea aestivalis]